MGRRLRLGERGCRDCGADLGGRISSCIRCTVCAAKNKNQARRERNAAAATVRRVKPIECECLVCGRGYTEYSIHPRKTCSHVSGSRCAAELRVRNAVAKKVENGVQCLPGEREVTSRARRLCLRGGMLCIHYVSRALTWKGFVACCKGGGGYVAPERRRIDDDARYKAICIS